MTQGRCLCGTVRYEVDGPWSSLLSCHCSMCRKHHGSGFATFASAPIAGFRWLAGEASIGSYASSPNGNRSFCRTCGSVTPTLLPEMGICLCPAGNLEGDLGLRPQGHMFVGSKAPWLDITDGLPQFEEYPPGFGIPSTPRPAVEPRPGLIQGSCLCSGVAYEIEGTPLRMMNCHCSRCRLARSAAHGTNLFVKVDQFRWVRGEAQITQYKVPEAVLFTTAFCQGCGSGTPRISRERGMAVVPSGGLDTDPGIRPMFHIFVGSRASWFEITGDLPQYQDLPPQA